MVEQETSFAALTDKIAERGFQCSSYKEKCLRRRIAVRMRARGVHTFTDYARILERDQGEYERLLDVLTINVTKLFRNWDVYAAMLAKVVPELWHRESAAIRVWSAGCSSGEEPYSLAILFHRYASTAGMLPQIGRVRVLGSDIDRESLVAARRGEYEESDFADTPTELRTRYFSSSRPYSVVESIRDLVRFERRDILTDDPPPAHYDLVVCRNVLIYFDRQTQERVFDLFYDILAPGGYLVLGKVETLLGTARARFSAIDARERIFRRA